MANDLTFQQLSDSLPSNSVMVSNGSTALPSGIYLNVSAISGDVIDGLNDMGVVETLLKTLQGANKAQALANTNVATGSRLNAFANPTFGAPIVDATSGVYYASMTIAITGRAPLDISSLVGTLV